MMPTPQAGVSAALFPLKIAMMVGVWLWARCWRPAPPFRPRHVVITGAGSGIGGEMARQLALKHKGLTLTLGDVNEGNVSAVARECEALGATARATTVDVTDRSATAAWLLAADDALPVDCVFANAGIASVTSGVPNHTTDEALDEVMHRVMAVNATGVVNTVGPLIARMKARGSGTLVITASQAAFALLTADPAYSASKAAAHALARSLRMRLHAHGVRVVALCPGWIGTPLTDAFNGRQIARMSVSYAVGRMLDGVARDEPVVNFPFIMTLLITITHTMGHWLMHEAFARLPLSLDAGMAYVRKTAGSGTAAASAGVEPVRPLAGGMHSVPPASREAAAGVTAGGGGSGDGGGEAAGVGSGGGVRKRVRSGSGSAHA